MCSACIYWVTWHKHDMWFVNCTILKIKTKYIIKIVGIN